MKWHIITVSFLVVVVVFGFIGALVSTVGKHIVYPEGDAILTKMVPPVTIVAQFRSDTQYTKIVDGAGTFVTLTDQSLSAVPVGGRLK